MKKMNKLYYLKIEINELKEEIKNISTISSMELTGMPHSNNVGDPVFQCLIKKQKLIEKLNNKLEKYIDELSIIENIIEDIDDAEIRLIARLRFIENLKWEEIARKVNLDRSVCYRKLKKYL